MPDAIETERVGDLIVQVFYDETGYISDPRDNDNLSVIYGSHRSYKIGDGEPPSDEMRILERGGIRLLWRYLRLFGDIVAFTKLGMYDHSGVSYYPVEMGNDGIHVFDHGGWDSGVTGYAYITRKRWIEIMGEETDPHELVDSTTSRWPQGLVNRENKIERALEVIESEITEYSQWANGQVYGYTVTKPCVDTHHKDDDDEAIAACPHSEVIDSCWGFIGDTDYALEEGKSVAKYASDHPAVPA